MDKLRQTLNSEIFGVDAWYDSKLEDAIVLMREIINDGKIDECFQLVNELPKNEQIRFFEAITEVHDISLIPRLFSVLKRADTEIAEPIIDGLRGWNLRLEEREMLKEYAIQFCGKSKLLDKVIDSFMKN